MTKVICPNAQDFSEPVAALIKISSRGLLGGDKIDFVKRAGAEFAHKLSDIKFEKDEIPVHLIAIGATEDYGPNRNGDGFKRACCRDYHDTFVKHARFYRDHINKNPAKSYGVIKASAYHDPMRRIELVCGLNGTQEAAERNGGLVADRELEKLARGNDIPVSMACTIAYDVCSECGNKAKTRMDYCDATETGGHCKSGGLRRNIGKCLENGNILHADNPHPRFFDISHVFRPADRIAYVSGMLDKSASSATISGAELAEQLGITSPISYQGNAPASVIAQLAALEKLAAVEYNPSSAAGSTWAKVVLSHASVVQPALLPDETIKLADALRALADVGVILPVSDFLALTLNRNDAKLAADVSVALSGIFSKMATSEDIVSNLEQNPYNPCYAASPRARLWASKVATTRSCVPTAVASRAYTAALRATDVSLTNITPMPNNTEKAASVNPAANSLARHYAMYKLSAFAEFTKKYDANGLTAEYCVMQNYVQ